ncbi:hypothetical protein AVEN_233168-1 [Araneus ventricosus]|uniref:HTH psq-type domain-containing protein n=1 Tax=Araneus ventricosus TaxID=182803 RepID=A0A4Y2EGM8_ARAVE|nr:hypothetical protein AVEN_233168-1 [Araneus ventricosus]
MSGVKRKRNVLNVKQKLEIRQKLDNGESASTDAEDVLHEGNTISHPAALQSVETLLDYMGQRGFDYGDITAVRKIFVDIRQEMNKPQKQRRITDFFKAANLWGRGRVAKSRLRKRWTRGSKPDSTEAPPCSCPIARQIIRRRPNVHQLAWCENLEAKRRPRHLTVRGSK